MNGYILVDKPKGWTSFDVVNKIRRIIELSKFNNTAKKRFPVGHTGTLDPLATGLLVILVGDYTKRAAELSKLDKTYEVTMTLGQISTTGDNEGEKSVVSDIKPDQSDIVTAIKSFEGKIEQTPPAYSAIKIGGQRAYKLARAGKQIKIEPRVAEVYKISDIMYEYSIVTFTARVSSGTYIRSLVEEIGQKLGTGAFVSNLNRSQVGQFELKDSINMASASGKQIYGHLQALD